MITDVGIPLHLHFDELENTRRNHFHIRVQVIGADVQCVHRIVTHPEFDTGFL